MIESLFSPKMARKKPWHAFIVAMVLTIASVILVMQVGSSSAQGAGIGLLLVSFITIAATPLFLSICKMEEAEEKKRLKGNLFERHRDIIEIFGFFFIGVIITSSLLIVLFPKTSETLFFDQKNDLISKGIISANAVSGIGFFEVLLNNLKVMALIFIFSLVFGAGAIFILSWNATVIGSLIAKIAEAPAQFGSISLLSGNVLANYVVALPFTLLRLLPHGFFEFIGYFIAAVAGGIISVAMIRERLLKNKELVLMDAGKYMVIGIVCIAIGAAIETL